MKRNGFLIMDSHLPQRAQWLSHRKMSQLPKFSYPVIITKNMNYIICHYGEIALKRGNRKFFEDKLIPKIKAAFENQAPVNFSAKGGPAFGWEFVKRISGRILIKLSENGQISDIKCQVSDVLKNVFGIVHFSFAVSTEQNIESIQKAALELLK